MTMGFIKTIEVIGGVILIALVFGVPAYLYLSHAGGAKYRKAFFGRRVIKEQSMEIPLDGNFCAAATVASYMLKTDEKSMTEPVTAAYYLKWLDEGVMSPGKEGSERCLILNKAENPFKDSVERKLYDFARKASRDGVSLTSEKLDGWAYLHHTQVLVSADFKEAGMKWFKKHGYFYKDGVFSPVLTPEGQAEAVKVVALKNYLDAAAKGKEGFPPEGTPIMDYMRYALLFGLEDDLCQAWQSILPEGFASNLKMCKDFVGQMELQRSLAADKEAGFD